MSALQISLIATVFSVGMLIGTFAVMAEFASHCNDYGKTKIMSKWYECKPL